MKIKKSKILARVSKSSIYKKLSYLSCIFLGLFLFTNLAYGFTEYGVCDFTINKDYKVEDKDGFSTGKRQISWKYHSEKLGGNKDTDEFRLIKTSADGPMPSANDEYGNIIEYKIPTNENQIPVVNDFRVNLTKSRTKDGKHRFLIFEKKSKLISDAKSEEYKNINVMTVSVYTNTEAKPGTYEKNQITQSRDYSIADGGTCHIIYKNNGVNTSEDINIIGIKNPWVGVDPNTKLPNYIIPKLENEREEKKAGWEVPSSPKGICLFEKDVLSTNDENTNDAVAKTCLERNFLVGITSSSNITIDDTCEEYNISSNFCKLLKNNDTFYNLDQRFIPYGFYDRFYKSALPGEERTRGIGYIKAFQAHKLKTSHSTIKDDKCVLLIDNNPIVLQGYVLYGMNKRYHDKMSIPDQHLRPQDGSVDNYPHFFSFFQTYSSNYTPVPHENETQQLSLPGIAVDSKENVVNPANINNLVSQLIDKGCK